MGVTHLKHLGGNIFYVCNSCLAYLANKEDVLSTRFTSGSGPAMLFKRVVNVVYSEVIVRNLVTGSHFIRDIYCKKCALRLGWYYEFAKRKSQTYKEGRAILEEAMICERESPFE